VRQVRALWFRAWGFAGKHKMKTINLAAAIPGLLLCSSPHGYGQTNIQIIGVVPTIEQAIQLTWTSVSN
jgi:hypothetical protein